MKKDTEKIFQTGIYQNGLYCNPINCSLNKVDAEFKNLCLIFALFAGWNLNLFENKKINKQQGKLLSRLFKTKLRKSDEILKGFNMLRVYLTRYFENWKQFETTKMTFEDTHGFCHKNDIQVHVFILNGKTETRHFCTFPTTEYDPALYQIHLFYDEISEHVELLENLETFFNRHGKYCFICGKHFKKGFYKHKCENEDLQCYHCRRQILKPTYKKKLWQKKLILRRNNKSLF